MSFTGRFVVVTLPVWAIVFLLWSLFYALELVFGVYVSVFIVFSIVKSVNVLVSCSLSSRNSFRLIVTIGFTIITVYVSIIFNLVVASKLSFCLYIS